MLALSLAKAGPRLGWHPPTTRISKRESASFTAREKSGEGFFEERAISFWDGAFGMILGGRGDGAMSFGATGVRGDLSLQGLQGFTEVYSELVFDACLEKKNPALKNIPRETCFRGSGVRRRSRLRDRTKKDKDGCEMERGDGGRERAWQHV